MPLFRTPTPEDRARLADDYRERLALVLRDGWGPYAGTWSSGQTTVVRALLSGDETEMSAACEALAPSLWGMDGAAADRAAGFARTYAWLQEVARG
ncbi:MAG: hypothetical protein H6523_12995 [Mycolicibacterium sp.]|nr:hypothetical protein [Mycolicibacterium sp.]